MNHINFNGKIVSADTMVAGADNRGLRFGDGLFETIKFKNDQLQLSEGHYSRLWQGLHLLKFALPPLFTKEFLESEIRKLLKKNKHTHARVRLTIFRGDGGLYDAVNHYPNFVIQSWPLAAEYGLLNSNGLDVCIFKAARKSCDQYSSLKHNSFLPYVAAALYAKEQHCNDAFILNEHGRLADSTISNIFLITDNVIHTPPISEGCIAGTMRHLLLGNLTEIGYKIVETPITESQLNNADEIFLTNAMTPLRWVKKINDREYSNLLITKLNNDLRQTFPSIFC